ncbi:MAG: hypothetical protein IT207_11820 [Fimbriimonadaceae bacterium]|nr:hypothetical protein [Fimbriimonadaceae bacterium]
MSSAIALVTAALAAATLHGGNALQPEQEGDRTTAVLAMRMRSQARLSADGTLPPNALVRAKQQRDALLASQSEPQFDATSWTALGPGNIGGRIRAIVIHPTQLSTMWIASVGGGVWKTTNGGASWAPLDDFMASLCASCMVLDPTNPDVLYVGTGEGFFETLEGSMNTAAIKGAGIFRTTDGGTTWQQLASTATPDFELVNRLAISPTNSNILLAGTSTGLWRSTDAGATWARTYTGWVYDVRFHKTDGNRVVLGLHAGAGAAYSSNGGQTWTDSTGLSGGHRVELDWSDSVDTNIYACRSSGDFNRVYKSTNNGASFTLKTSGSGIDMYEAYNNALWVDPTNDNNVIIGGVYLFRSTNQGATFSDAFSNVHPDHHVIVEVPNFDGTSNRRVYFGHDGGISTAANVYSDTTSDLNNGLQITQFYGAGMNNATGVMVAGAQDNYTLRFSGDPDVWSIEVGGDGGFSTADPTNSNYFYGGSQWIGLRRSSNGGLSWTSISAGISDAGSGGACNFISYYRLDPNNPNTFLVCARRLWRSTNIRGTTGWTSIKAAIPGPDEPGAGNAHMNPSDPRNISTCEIATGNSNVIWVGHNNGQVFKTTNGTAATPTWTRMDVGSPLPDRWVSRIVIDRSNHNRVYVSFMGWEGDNIWKTEDGGTTWVPVNGVGARKIPMAPVSALALDPLRPGRLFAGTDIGIFTTWDDGATWSVVTQGPGTVPIDELVWRNDTQLLAVTYGRGVMQATVTATNVLSTPLGFTVFRGQTLSGGLAELTASDDQRLVVRKGVVANSNESPVTVDFTAVAPQTIASSIQIELEAGASTTGLSQKIQAFDYDAGAWVDLDERAATTADQITNVTISTNVSRFIRPSDREIKLRALYRQVGPVLMSQWTVGFDLVRWTTSQ